ncbi:MAG: thiol peroxidase [Candidatus Omnitrophica bacterium]|nr:thiol peroxidase [Candidatus Omnitrophota bacterium]
MSDQVTFKGSVLTLVGRKIKVGSSVPDFRVVSGELKEIRLSDFAGKIKVINFFPSIDTPVCDVQVKEFNKRAADLSSDIAVIGISKDLPFAQKRFCDAHDISKEVVLSDYKTSSFGINYGVLIKELNLLARGVVVIDAHNILRYRQIVPEITRAVNFDDALKAAEEVVRIPQVEAEDSLPDHCKPCEKGVAALPRDRIDKLLAARRGWDLVEGKRLTKEFTCKDFLEAKYFVDFIAVIAEEQGHHPTLTLGYAKVKVSLSTHAAAGLTENDFIMARAIDELKG